MIEKIIEFSAKNKFLVVILTGVALLGAVYSMKRVPLDAIPDLSDTQVIIYSRWDRSPDILEDQVTYPIITAMLGAPKVKAIRGFSDFGYSYVYIIFQDGTDLYWARSRVLEYLSKIQARLPEGVRTELGPDATGVGWVYQYALVDKTGRHDLADLRGFQDWTLRYWLESVPGVAEVASIGGFQKQYQVLIDPNALVAYNVPLSRVVDAIRSGNNDVGGRLVEFSGAEYMVRGRGYAKTISDIENIVVGNGKSGTPILVRSLGRVSLGPEMRRGVSDLDGQGDTVGGIIIMRQGENALNVINRVKEKIREISPSLPEGVQIIPTYDRSELIKHSIHTLKHELLIEMVIVSLVILLFLWHFPSAVIPIVTIPISVVLSFIPLYLMGLTSNIMSLSGIAISIGVLVDGAIVEVENAYKRLEEWNEAGRPGNFHEVRLNALKEVGPSVFFSLLVIAVAFMPVFTLVDQAGRLFKPLAYAKNFAMAIAALLAVTLDPAVRMMFTKMDPTPSFRRKPEPSGVNVAGPRLATAGVTIMNSMISFWNTITVGRYYKEDDHPISKRLFKMYEPVCRWALRHRRRTTATAFVLVVLSVPVIFGWGEILVAPLRLATLAVSPIISSKASQGTREALDKLREKIDDIFTFYPKLGSEFMPPLDEGSLLFMPTTLPGLSVTGAQELMQKQDQIIKSFPEVDRVFGKAGRAETATDPAPFSMMETTILLKPQKDWRAGMTKDKLIDDLDQALKILGVTNAWTMPIKNRVDMLSTGIRTPVGIKILGPDLKTIEQLGTQLEGILKEVPGTRSVFAERAAGGYFLDFTLKREQLARYGLSVKDVEEILMTAIGGEPITTTVEGRERYTINVRYPRELRDSLPKLQRVLVPTGHGANIPLEELADIELKLGPAMIRDENGMLAGYVFIDMAGRDVGGYVEEAKKIVEKNIHVPTGYALAWSGQYENILKVRESMKIVLPITLFLIFLLLYMNTKSAVKASIVMLAVPFSVVGAVWYLYFLGYNMSIAVWVGMIALAGLDAETGVFMLLFLDLSYDAAVKKGMMRSESDLTEAIIHGAVKRVRPKMMTVCAAFMGLLPIMWSGGAGSDMMKRVAAPMIGGLLTSFLLELLVYPPLYATWKRRSLPSP